MTESQLKNAREHYHGFLETQRALEGQSAGIPKTTWQPMVDEINRAIADFPGIMRPFTVSAFAIAQGDGGPVLSTASLREYVGLAAARLKVEVEGGIKRFTLSSRLAKPRSSRYSTLARSLSPLERLSPALW